MGVETISRAVSGDAPPRIHILAADEDLVALVVAQAAADFKAALQWKPRAWFKRGALAKRLGDFLEAQFRAGWLEVNGERLSPRLAAIHEDGTIGVPREWLDSKGELPIDDGQDMIEELSWALQESAAEAVNADVLDPTPFSAAVGFAATQAIVVPLDTAEVRLDSAKGPWALMLCATRDGRTLMLPKEDIAHHEYSDGPAQAQVARSLLRKGVPDEEKTLDAIAKLLNSRERPLWGTRYARYFPPEKPLAAEARADYPGLVRTVLDQTAEYTLVEALEAAEFRGPPRDEARRRWMLAMEEVFAPERAAPDHYERPLIAFVNEGGGLVLPARCIDSSMQPKASSDDIALDKLRGVERRLAEISAAALVQSGMPPNQAWRVSAWTLHEMLSRIDDGSYEFDSGERMGAVLCLEMPEATLTLPRSDRKASNELFAAVRPVPGAMQG